MDAPPAEDRVAATGVPALDAALGGGLRRGHLSEIVGAAIGGPDDGCVPALAAAATSRGEVVALDRYLRSLRSGVGRSRRPRSVAAAVDSRTATPTRALKAMNLVLQAGGFGLVALDLADVRGRGAAAVSRTRPGCASRASSKAARRWRCWSAREHIARSPGGVTIALERGTPAVEWREPLAPRCSLTISRA